MSLDALIIVLTAGGVVFGYLGWRAASNASRYAKESLNDSRAPRLSLRTAQGYGGGFIIANVGKDMAKNIVDTNKLFTSVPIELLASIVPPTYDPRQGINRSVTTQIFLVRPVDPLKEIIAAFEYENSFGEKFTSQFTIANLQKPNEAQLYAPYKVTEKDWKSRNMT